MTLRPIGQIAGACARKVKYSSESKAREAGNQSLRRSGDEQGIDRLFPYACTHCRHWHLTKELQPHTIAITRQALREGIPA